MASRMTAGSCAAGWGWVAGAVAGFWAAIELAVTTEWERGTAFLFVPVFLAIGAVSYFSLELEPSAYSLGAGVALLGAASFLARARPALHLTVTALMLVLLGMFFGWIETQRAGTKVLGGEISTALTGRVAVIEHQANGRVRLTLDVLDTARPKLRYAPDRVRVSARAVPADLVVTAVNDEGLIMGLRHVKYDVKGLQFHPESVMTTEGPKMIANWLEKK